MQPSHILPKVLRTEIVRKANTYFSRVRKAAESALPKFELSEAHLRNIKVLPSRKQLLENLPRGSVCAELGVDTGTFSEAILQITKPAKLHLVDAWDSARYGETKAESVAKKFADQVKTGSVQFHRGLSTERVNDFHENYFDWIYIDTDHSYNTTLMELQRYAPKMKPDGIIAGHDFSTANWVGGIRYGVKEAVHEFCVQENWEFVFLTMEISDHPSFAIRKIR